eukprot:SAG31_NODE_183_length_20987_cov_8.711078_19_plen_201_part_00
MPCKLTLQMWAAAGIPSIRTNPQLPGFTHIVDFLSMRDVPMPRPSCRTQATGTHREVRCAHGSEVNCGTWQKIGEELARSAKWPISPSESGVQIESQWLAFEEFLPQQLDPSCFAIVASGAETFFVAHRMAGRGTQVRHQLRPGDALVRSLTAAKLWTIAVPPVRPKGAGHQTGDKKRCILRFRFNMIPTAARKEALSME